MWNRLGKTLLKAREVMEICSVKTPDRYYGRKISSFLPCHNELWQWHLNLSVRGKLDELGSRFYLGLVNDKIISNVSTWEYGPIGIVGHLFTLENHRGKGACTALMNTQIQDFRNRGGKILIGGFKPSSYPIAKRLGFKSITDNSEVMRYNLFPRFENEYFEAKKAFCRDSMWKDWPGVSLLFGIKEGWHLRSIKHKIFGPFDYEDYFLEDMQERLKGLCASKVLVTEEGNIVGYSTLTFMNHAKDGVYMLDLFIHPKSIFYAYTMLESMRFPKGKTRCYVEPSCREKLDILLRFGFKERAVRKLTKQDRKALEPVAMEF